jgi:hypothetical protein
MAILEINFSFPGIEKLMLIIKKKEGGVFSTQKEKETSSFAGLIITTRKPENERLSAPGENERKQKKMVCYITTARSSLLLFPISGLMVGGCQEMCLGRPC